MKVILEDGGEISADWVELWHENNTVLVGVGGDAQTYSIGEIDKITKE